MWLLLRAGPLSRRGGALLLVLRRRLRSTGVTTCAQLLEDLLKRHVIHRHWIARIGWVALVDGELRNRCRARRLRECGGHGRCLEVVLLLLTLLLGDELLKRPVWVSATRRRRSHSSHAAGLVAEADAGEASNFGTDAAVVPALLLLLVLEGMLSCREERRRAADL